MEQTQQQSNPRPVPGSVPTRGKVKLKTVLVAYDRLSCKQRDEKASIWEGAKGTYVLESTGVVQAGKPVQRVYLNRKYLSGLFTGKKPGEYSGDVKDLSGKHYLLFRLVDRDTIEVLERVPAGNG